MTLEGSPEQWLELGADLALSDLADAALRAPFAHGSSCALACPPARLASICASPNALRAL
jgi:hypothetical protein